MKSTITLLLIIFSFKIAFSQNEEWEGLTAKRDVFTGIKTIRTPFFIKDPIQDYVNLNAIFYKVINKKDTSYKLYLCHKENAVHVNEKGLFIILNDGTRINKPEVPIHIAATSEGYSYSGEFTLNKNEMAILKTSTIKAFRLFRYNEFVDSTQAEKIKGYFIDLLSAK